MRNQTSSAQSAQPSYRYAVIDIGTGQVTAINNSGQVVGNDEYGPFMWDMTNGKRNLSDTLESSTIINDINNNGQVVGSKYFAEGSRAFLWDSINETITNLGTQTVHNYADSSVAYGISDTGYVVGQATGRAFLWNSMNGMSNIGAITLYSPGGCTYCVENPQSAAYKVNNSGQAVGDSQYAYDTATVIAAGPTGVVWAGGGISELLPRFSGGVSINDSGQVIYNATSAHTQAYLSGTQLGSLGNGYSTPTDINNNGQVVGGAGISDGTSHAFLWDSTNGMSISIT